MKSKKPPRANFKKREKDRSELTTKLRNARLASTNLYSRLYILQDNTIAGDTFVFAVKQHVQCTFEGLGSLHGCRHEDYRRQGGKGAINGLHSDWVTEDVLAMARPSDRLIQEYDIVGQFKKAGVAGIINLQVRGM
jgi:hypothetical protein